MSIDRPISDRPRRRIQNALSMLYLRVISENNVFSAWVSRSYRNLGVIQHFGFSEFSTSRNCHFAAFIMAPRSTPLPGSIV